MSHLILILFNMGTVDSDIYTRNTNFITEVKVFHSFVVSGNTKDILVEIHKPLHLLLAL